MVATCSTMLRLYVICLVFGVLYVPDLRGQSAFRAGEPVPAPDISRWISTETVKAFQPGRLYLVEFTHTQCKPCREAIPHLSELAANYKDHLTVVSIYSYFSTDKKTEEVYAGEIKRLREQMKGLMGYAIAIDHRDGAMHNRWRNGAGSFPYVFLVDGRGRLAWWGLPDPVEMEKVIRSLIAGDYQAAQVMAKNARFERIYGQLMSGGHPASGSLDSALVLVAGLRREYPDKDMELHYLVYNWLLPKDAALASVYLEGLLERYSALSFDPEHDFIVSRHAGLEWKLGLELFDRNIRRSEHDTVNVVFALFKKSKLYAFNGCYDEAVSTLKEAIGLHAAAFGENRKAARPLKDWLQAYSFRYLLERDTVQARDYLYGLLARQELSLAAATVLLYRLNEGLSDPCLADVQDYVRAMIRRLKLSGS